MSPAAPLPRTFDRLPNPPSRNAEFPARALLRASVEPVQKYWAQYAVLDQGQEGSCVGHGWTGELLNSPRPDPYTGSNAGHTYAVGVYNAAKLVDEYPGTNYEGTSVLAGAKVVQSRKFIDGYHWATTTTDVRDAVITLGPVVIGIDWHDNMYSTDSNGLVDTGGVVVGGHCLLINGYNPAKKFGSKTYEVFRWRNSWGSSYGLNGSAFIRLSDFDNLLRSGGDACVPSGRHLVRLSGSTYTP